MARRDELPAIPRQPDPVTERRPLGRALTILEVLAESDDGLGISELARRAGLPKTTTSRILTDLVGMGLVLRTRNQHLPGHRLLELADRFESPGLAARRRLLVPHLLRLRDETGLAVAFATLRYRQVRFESVLFGVAQIDALTSLPLWAPTHRTATGRVLLAYAPRAERLLPAGPDGLQRQLGRIRMAGTAAYTSEYVPNVSAVASPVFGGQDFVGALAVCGLRGTFDTRTATTLLRRIASEATVAMRRHAETLSG